MIGDRPNLRHFAALAATVRYGSVNRAARAINLSQPALTQAIKGLEDVLGVTLFERNTRGMTPTEPGLLLAARAESALGLVGSPRVTGTQMRAFIAIARHGSYASASTELKISSASLHRAVADLSVALGQRLYDRRGRSIVLTPTGHKRARSFSLAMTEIQAGLAEVSSWLGKNAGRMVIGAMPLSRERWLPDTLGSYATNTKGIEIVVREGNHAELIGPLRDGDIDILLGALRESELTEDLVQEHIFDNRLAIVMRKGHPISKTNSVDSMVEYPWILPGKTTPMRQFWEKMIDSSSRGAPKIWIECGSVMLVRHLLQRSDALTLLSPDQVSLELHSGVLELRTTPIPLVRSIGMITRHGWRPTKDQAEFIDALRISGKKLSI